MDFSKFVDSLQAILYEVFGLILPGACSCLLVAPFVSPIRVSAAAAFDPDARQSVAIIVALYFAGTVLSAGRSLESQMWTLMTRPTKRPRKKEQTEQPHAGSFDASQDYPDRNVYLAARTQIGNYFGIPADSLSGLETFNLCLSVAGGKAAEYRKFIALKGMMRGLGFALTITLVLSLVRLALTPQAGLDVAPLLAIFGVKVGTQHVVLGSGRMFYSGLVIVFIAMKYAFSTREKRYEDIGRRIVYPLALTQLAEQSKTKTTGVSDAK